MNPNNTKKNWYIAAICLAVIMSGIVFYFFTANFAHVVAFGQEVNEVLAPVYAGAIIAFLLSPIHESFFKFFLKNLSNPIPSKRKAMSNGLSILMSLAIAFFAFYLLMAMLLPQLYLSVENLINSVPESFSITTPEWLEEFFVDHPEAYENIAPYYESTIIAIENWVATEIMPKINSAEEMMSFAKDSLLPHLTGVMSSISLVVGSFVSLIFDSLVAIIVSVNILARKRTFLGQWKKLAYALFSIEWADFLLREVRNAYRIMSGFINGKLLDSLIIGIIALIGAYILDFPYAPLIATIIGVTNIIPFFGPFIGGVPCGVLIFLVSPIKCLYFIVFIVALQQFDGNILGPKILGDSTGLSSFWVLFAILLFGGIFGLAGMILGVPVFATFYSMVSRFIKYLLKKKNMPEETLVYERKEYQLEPLTGQEIVSHWHDLEKMDAEEASEPEESKKKKSPKDKSKDKSSEK